MVKLFYIDCNTSGSTHRVKFTLQVPIFVNMPSLYLIIRVKNGKPLALSDQFRTSKMAGGFMVSFKVGDNAVYPGHGVGKVTAIETKEILGTKHTFYSINILDSGMKIMVPKNNAEAVGLRPIISRDEAKKVIEILRETNVKIDNQTWNRRYREYMEKIKTGSVYQIAEVLRDLFLLKVDKELSFGERKMLDSARTLLLRELSLATGHEELRAQDEVRAIFNIQ
jgi:CarD family transcriptional regulator